MVTLGFYPATAWGGPVKIVHQIGRELVCRGHRVTVYCTNLLDKRSKLRPGTFERRTFERWVDGMRVVYFDTWCLPWWPGTLGPFWPPHLPGYVRREIAGFDLVHLHGSRSFMLLPVVHGARKAGVPFVMQPHGTLPVASRGIRDPATSWPLGKQLYDWLLGGQELKGLSALIALQESERQQALARGIPDHLVEIIPNGLDLSPGQHAAVPSRSSGYPKPGSFRHRHNIPSDRPLILFLGRINKIKGVDMLVEAFAQMVGRPAGSRARPHRLDLSPGPHGLDAHLAIAGPDDGQLGRVQQLIRQHSLGDRVVLPGLLPESEVMAAYRDADLFALPSRSDTFPTAIMEACLAGTPMVVTDGCEIAHLLRDRVADVVPFDPGAFAQAMVRLLTDGERYQRYAENCPDVMRDSFSLEVTVDRLERVYERVVEERC
jgi:glycosyltransferase involved in cell wall biosynthesis